MALVLADRVLETTVVAGTGDASLGGAVLGYQPFSVIGGGNTTYYTIVAIDDNGAPTGDWEVGIGTYVVTGNKLTRDTVLSSSNGGAKVYFASGTKQVFLDLPSEEVLLTAGNVYGPASAVNSNFALFDGTTGKLLKDAGINASTFATAAQGAKADTAVQPGSLGSAAYLTAGAANGVATLDSGGKVPTSQIPQMGDLNYQGTWNASTNTPTLTSSAGTKGFYYVVSVAGSTNLNGITDWKVSDWAVFNGSVWQKIDNTDAVNSVNGYTGTVVLTYTDVGAQPAGTYVTSVSATSPVTSSGGTTPTIAMPAATTSVSGYLTSTDWNTFNNKSNTTGTVTSVSGTGTVSGISLSGTVTSSGNLTLGGTLDLSSPPAIGSTTPNTGAFTYLFTNSTTSTTPTLSFNGSNSNYAGGATVAGNYLQNLLQNKSGTAGASTNYVLSNDLGTDSTYYGEFGMNSSVYSSGTPADFFSLNNGVYFSAHDGDVTIGSGNGYKTYFAWGTAGQSAHVINASGAIGLNTSITGSTNFGTANQFMQSAGSTATPVWSSTLSGATINNTNTITVKGSSFTLQDATDTTKQANFVLSGLTTGTTYAYTLPAVSGAALATLGNISQTFAGATTFSNTALTFGNSTSASTVNISNGATASGSTNTIAIGTSGLTGSTTAITIGGGVGSSTTTMGGAVTATGNVSFNGGGGITTTIGNTTTTGTITLGRSTVSQTVNVSNGVTASGSTNTINIGASGAAGSTTAIAIGSTAGTSTATANGTWTFSTPLAATNMTQSTTSTSGYLSSTDWNTFNGKAPATSGTSILYGNGSGGFSNVTVGTGLSFSAGTLSNSGVTSISFGSTGLTPSTSTTGAVSVAGTLAVANGGTGVTASTGASSVVLRDASQSINVANTFGFKNRIINGAMSIWQRNATLSTNNTQGYYLDRMWGFSSSTVATYTQGSSSGLTGFPYFSRAQRTAGNTGTNGVFMGQIIESNNLQDLQGQSVTVSFWARAGANYSPVGNTLTVLLRTGTVADQGLNVLISGWTGAVDQTSNVTLTTSWQYFSKTFTVASNVQEIASFFQASTTGTAGANDYYDITGFQLEKGTTATSFDYRPYGTELALCQRYYLSAPANSIIFNPASYNSAQFPVTMRATPTVTVTPAAGSTTGITASTYGFYATNTLLSNAAYTASVEL